MKKMFPRLLCLLLAAALLVVFAACDTVIPDAGDGDTQNALPTGEETDNSGEEPAGEGVADGKDDSVPSLDTVLAGIRESLEGKDSFSFDISLYKGDGTGENDPVCQMTLTVDADKNLFAKASVFYDLVDEEENEVVGVESTDVELYVVDDAVYVGTNALVYDENGNGTMAYTKVMELNAETKAELEAFIQNLTASLSDFPLDGVIPDETVSGSIPDFSSGISSGMTPGLGLGSSGANSSVVRTEDGYAVNTSADLSSILNAIVVVIRSQLSTTVQELVENVVSPDDVKEILATLGDIDIASGLEALDETVGENVVNTLLYYIVYHQSDDAETEVSPADLRELIEAEFGDIGLLSFLASAVLETDISDLTEEELETFIDGLTDSLFDTIYSELPADKALGEFTLPGSDLTLNGLFQNFLFTRAVADASISVTEEYLPTGLKAEADVSILYYGNGIPHSERTVLGIEIGMSFAEVPVTLPAQMLTMPGIEDEDIRISSANEVTLLDWTLYCDLGEFTIQGVSVTLEGDDEGVCTPTYTVTYEGGTVEISDLTYELSDPDATLPDITGYTVTVLLRAEIDGTVYYSFLTSTTSAE